MYTSNMTTLYVACKALIYCNEQYLIIRESTQYTEGTNAGKWDVPGGRINPGEHWQQALKREVLEEVGLEIEIQHPVHTDEWFPVIKGEQSQVIATYYKCKATTNTVALGSDHDAYKWITKKELTECELVLPSVKAALNNL